MSMTTTNVCTAEPRVTGRRASPVKESLGLRELRIVAPIGTGRRCTAWRAIRHGRDLVAKRFTDRAAAKHASRHGVSIARFEFERNTSLFAVHELRSNVARPLGFVASGSQQVFLQEFVDGLPLLRYAASASESERSLVHAELLRIVAIAHDASFYDLDLHPKNILVRRRVDGLPGVVLFDFNKIPYHEWPPNAVARRLVAFGYIKPESRDLRHLCAIAKVLRLAPEAALDSACRQVGVD